MNSRTVDREWRLRHGPLLVSLASLALAGCGDAAGPAAPPTGPAAVEIMAGAGQRSLPGRPLSELVYVRVLDVAGRPLPDATVVFTPAAGHGWVTPVLAATNPNGEAATRWILGESAGTQTLTATAATVSTTTTAEALDLEAELDVLFAPPSEAEVDAVRADWSGRDFSAAQVSVELTEEYSLAGAPATLRIVSHVVAGARHFGAIVIPIGATERSLPVLAYLHGGDSGVSVDDLQIVGYALGEASTRFAYVIPSFRGEPLEYGDRVWVSEGPPSPWDYDVDDALALVNVALESTPEAKPSGLSIVGGSRGAGVALLAGARDERIERIVAFFGPTDFFDDWVRGLVREAANGDPRNLTGVAHFDSTLIRPFITGEIPVAEARLGLVRRSSVLFAADLPAVQLHHGTDDETVAVSQAEAMIHAMEGIGRGPPDFEAFIYEGGTHDFFSMIESIPRAAAFLRQVLASPRPGGMNRRANAAGISATGS